MFTQCPQCETVFRLGAGDLRRAQGRVRCGECNTVFNALDYLQEDDTPVVLQPQPAWLTDSGDNPPGDLAPHPDADTDDDAAALGLRPEDTEVGSHTEPTFSDDHTDDDADDTAWRETDTAAEWEFDADDDDEQSAHGILVLDDGDDASATDSTADATAAGDGDPDPADWQREAESFDPSIWERIPGVGALSEEPRPVSPDDWMPESDKFETGDSEPLADATDGARSDTDPDAAHAAEAADNEGPDALEFNVPQENWGNFFGPVPKADSLTSWRPPQFDPADASDDDIPDEPPFSLGTDDAAADTDDREPYFSLSDDDDENDAADSDDYADDPATETRELAPATRADSGEAEAEDNNAEPDDAPELASTDTAATVPPWRANAATETDATGGRSILWTLGTLLLLIALAAQLVHYNRDQLATNPQYGEQLRDLYARLPFDLYPHWPLSAYEVRGSEAVVGESGRDVLDIRARIVTTGSQSVGLPLLRVVLRDRWSNPVAARDFDPKDYAPQGTLPADGMLQPGKPQEAHLRIIDPGIGAQGFELELCLPRRHTGLECNSQPFR